MIENGCPYDKEECIRVATEEGDDNKDEILEYLNSL